MAAAAILPLRLQDRFYVDGEMIRRAIRRQSSFNLVHLGTGFKIREVSDRQWNDILGVVRTQGEKLDHDYLRQWASELGVADLLERALQAT